MTNSSSLADDDEVYTRDMFDPEQVAMVERLRPWTKSAGKREAFRQDLTKLIRDQRFPIPDWYDVTAPAHQGIAPHIRAIFKIMGWEYPHNPPKGWPMGSDKITEATFAGLVARTVLHVELARVPFEEELNHVCSRLHEERWPFWGERRRREAKADVLRTLSLYLDARMIKTKSDFSERHPPLAVTYRDPDMHRLLKRFFKIMPKGGNDIGRMAEAVAGRTGKKRYTPTEAQIVERKRRIAQAVKRRTERQQREAEFLASLTPDQRRAYVLEREERIKERYRRQTLIMQQGYAEWRADLRRMPMHQLKKLLRRQREKRLAMLAKKRQEQAHETEQTAGALEPPRSPKT